MQAIAKIIAGFGVLLVAAAVFLGIDAFATEERKAAVESQLDEMATRYEEAEGRRARRRDKMGGMAHMVQTLRNGVFFSAPVDLAEVLPLVPEGWESRVYTAADGETITGDALPTEGFTTTTTQNILRDFAGVRNTTLDVAQTYQSGDRLVAIRLESDLDRFRQLKKGSSGSANLLSPPARSPGLTVFGRVDGLAIIQEPQFSQNRQDHRYPVEYRHYTLSIGKVVKGQIITNAADADLAQLFSTLDVELVQSSLPRGTDRYDPDAGFVYLASDEPSTDLPGPSPALLAFQLRNGDSLTAAERHILVSIAQGKQRTQAVIKASPIWTEDIAEPVQEIVALLPEN